MKCELCHQAEVETVFCKIVNGETQELFVCHACAQKAAQPEPVQRTRQQNPVEQPSGASQHPILGMIVDAAFEILGQSEKLQEPACPVCGIRRSEYRKRSRLGCPACYEAFAKELDSALLEMYRAVRHVGKRPEQARGAGRRQELLDALAIAVTEQRYEEAISLRDTLRQLDDAATSEAGGQA